MQDLATIPENGKYAPLRETGDGSYLVKKDGGRYILSINGRTEECPDAEAVEKTIGSYEFFHQIGLKSIASSMPQFLEIAKKTNPVCPAFNIQNGFSEEQQAVLLGVVDRIFDLDMEQKMSAKSTKAILPDFTDKLRTVDQKTGFDARLRKK